MLFLHRTRERGRRNRLPLPWALALTTTVVFLVALGALGGLGYATSVVSRLAKSTRAEADPVPAVHARRVRTVTVCHGGRSKVVSRSTLEARLRRGDTLGRCRRIPPGRP
jgi:hypothetical protein